MAAIFYQVYGYMQSAIHVIVTAGATNRLLMENSDGILLEDSSGDLALE